ncbi:MAG: deoxyribodipyrimidine photo-lyase [Myxococcota bacterium]
MASNTIQWASTLTDIPDLRVTAVNDAPQRLDGDYVLYWMIANRRTTWNFALEHAIRHAQGKAQPLIVLEALRIGYRWASPRIHRFVIDGMHDNSAAFAPTPIAYHPYLEPSAGVGSGLLEALAQRASIVITDEFPCFFLPKMVAAAGKKLDVRLEQVDANGIMPLRSTEKAFSRAHDFRRFLQKTIRPHLDAFPEPETLSLASDLPVAQVPADIAARWPAADPAVLDGTDTDFLASLDIDQSVGVVSLRGGARSAAQNLERFLDTHLPRYAEARNHPDDDVASGLSPHLHFGHIGAHEIVERVLEAGDFSPDALGPAKGARQGFWPLSEAAQGFLDQIITWREVGYHFAFHRPDHADYSSLPGWAQATLAEHADDPREHIYDLDTLARADTYDDIWNAAQRQLVQTGRMHNYLRMLWGKKVLEWSATPRQALEKLVELNNRYALDGRNPNSYSGIFWIFGRFDRAWGPERPIYGKIRYMTSDSTRRKLHLKRYLETYGPGSEQGDLGL